MNVLDLFSGIGGFSLGLERAGMQTVAFCEIEKFPQRVLKKTLAGRLYPRRYQNAGVPEKRGRPRRLDAL